MIKYEELFLYGEILKKLLESKPLEEYLDQNNETHLWNKESQMYTSSDFKYVIQDLGLHFDFNQYGTFISDENERSSMRVDENLISINTKVSEGEVNNEYIGIRIVRDKNDGKAHIGIYGVDESDESVEISSDESVEIPSEIDPIILSCQRAIEELETKINNLNTSQNKLQEDGSKAKYEEKLKAMERLQAFYSNFREFIDREKEKEGIQRIKSEIICKWLRVLNPEVLKDIPENILGKLYEDTNLELERRAREEIEGEVRAQLADRASMQQDDIKNRA